MAVPMTNRPPFCHLEAFCSLIWVCAVIRRRFPVGANPIRRTLQPEAAGAAMEVDEIAEAFGKRITTYGDSASVQAVTRVNAEQASKRTMRRPTRQVRFPCVHAVATAPAQRLGVRVRSFIPAVAAFPERGVGSACASSFSRLARRSLALRPAHSRCHRMS